MVAEFLFPWVPMHSALYILAVALALLSVAMLVLGDFWGLMALAAAVAAALVARRTHRRAREEPA